MRYTIIGTSLGTVCGREPALIAAKPSMEILRCSSVVAAPDRASEHSKDQVQANALADIHKQMWRRGRSKP